MQRNISRVGLARKQRHQRYAIKGWIDCLADVPAFIIGNSPSIKSHDLSCLEPFFTIGVNRAFLLLDPTILIWQDISLWTTEYHKLHNTQALKVARDIADPKRIYYNFHLKGGPFAFDLKSPKTHILQGRGSTGPLAVELAVGMGCRPIILLGMDCVRGNKGESDFYGNNPHWLPHTLASCDKGLQFLKEQCPVEIINCGESALWPKHGIKEVIKCLNAKHSIGRTAYVRRIIQNS